VTVARLSGDLFVTFTAPDRVPLGPSWRGRCGQPKASPMKHGFRPPSVFTITDASPND
jgi:hypothetical protein